MPLDLLSDLNLKALDVRIFGGMAAKRNEDGLFDLGASWLARFAGVTDKTVAACVERLERFGYIAAAGKAPRGKAKTYRLLAPCFGTHSVFLEDGQGAKVIPMDSIRAAVKDRACLKCAGSCAGGDFCGGCLSDLEARWKLSRTA